MSTCLYNTATYRFYFKGELTKFKDYVIIKNPDICIYDFWDTMIKRN